MKILLIEDEIPLSEALVYTLKKNNYIVDTAFNGIDGENMAKSATYNLIILDRMLPGKDGLEVLKQLRNEKILTPILILTAKDSIEDRVEGLDSGADDYLVKPFSKAELLARVRALGRRQTDKIDNEELKVGLTIFSPLKGELTIEDELIKLSSKESQILEIMIKNKDIVITREHLLDRIWGFQSSIELNNIEVYISYLRKKLCSINCGFIIETIRGSGYCLKET
ncbi:response regulator transcription factor [Clostridium sp. SHJSY1]|uniref:response regulator transcription factor n=1 Tax=Clostridium sp. SHJSY1 TaxID=2942483 RepID=UPI002876F5D3|nr:response regulator transcription factor [Clostridium sp. SHJSY1]MDS0525971.1 response regulator transcription factor [Clostridium sp. SHJSY1]